MTLVCREERYPSHCIYYISSEFATRTFYLSVVFLWHHAYTRCMPRGCVHASGDEASVSVAAEQRARSFRNREHLALAVGRMCLALQAGGSHLPGTDRVQLSTPYSMRPLLYRIYYGQRVPARHCCANLIRAQKSTFPTPNEHEQRQPNLTEGCPTRT